MLKIFIVNQSVIQSGFNARFFIKEMMLGTSLERRKNSSNKAPIAYRKSSRNTEKRGPKTVPKPRIQEGSQERKDAEVCNVYVLLL